METRIMKNIINKNRRCRDVKTQKLCEQSREVNVGPKIKTNHFPITIHNNKVVIENVFHYSLYFHVVYVAY